MVNNQNEFNNKYNNKKEIKEIKIEDEYEFEGQLIVEDYPNLGKLYLHDVDGIDKITLKNLPQLQECTIWDCGTKELVIESCSKIERLNVRTNYLTNLKFLINLENLTELEVGGNAKLTELLKPYKGDWKSYKKDIQELRGKINQNPDELLKSIRNLKEKIKQLEEKQPITIDNSDDFQKKYQKLKGTLHFLIKEEKLKSKEIDKLVTDDILESVKDLKEDLSKTQKTKEELEQRLALYERAGDEIKQKENELLELKKNIITNNPEIGEDLEELLEAQKENSSKWLEKCKKRLVKQITTEQVDLLCQKQAEIIQLQKKVNQQETRINQIINNYYNQGFIIKGDNNTLTNTSVQGNTMETITYETETNESELQATIESPPPTNLLK